MDLTYLALYFKKISLADIGAVVLVIFLIALGIWIFLYLNHYSDWMKFKSKKKADELKKLQSYAKEYSLRIDHLIGNMSAYAEKTLLAEAEYYLKAFIFKSYELESKSMNVVETFDFIEKEEKEPSKEVLKSFKETVEMYKIVRFSKKEIHKSEIVNLLESIKIFMMQKSALREEIKK